MGSADVLNTFFQMSLKMAKSASSSPKNKIIDTTVKKSDFDGAPKLPWYRSGGLHITLNGMALNIFIPIYVLASQLPDDQPKQFLYLMASFIASAAILSRTIYCILIVPSYLASLLLCVHLHYSFLLLPISLILAIGKVNICMSVCLHRYAAHAAFRCGPITNVVMNVLGCLANQGGPVWWASQHRCHHKFCDVPRDPHSALLDGTEKAFGFFHHHAEVQEEFVPRQMDTTLLRILDTWSFLFVGMELYAAHYFLGNEGLFVAHTSAWLCQTITCWFNIVNHPAEKEEKCKASDGKIKLQSWYLPFHILDVLHPIFSLVVMEDEHEHHHKHAALAKRSPYDSAYWLFLKPLELIGLVWDIQV